MEEKIRLSKFEKDDAEFIQDNFSFAFRDCSITNLESIIEGWKNTLGFCIVYNNEKVGFIILSQKQEGKLGFGIAVRQEYRGLGIATKAFSLAKEKAKEKGYSVITSSCSADNYASKGLHEKLGFKIIKTETNSAGNEMYRWEMVIL